MAKPGRPSKYDPERAEKIFERLRVGCTRKDACLSAGISESTLARWLKNYGDFGDRIHACEAECAVRMTAVLTKAAGGFDTETRKETHTVNKKFVTLVKRTTFPDGRIIEEPVVLEVGTEVHTTEVTTSREFDWRAALEWLKRRCRVEWGDSIDIHKLDDETLLRLIAAADGVDEHGYTGS